MKKQLLGITGAAVLATSVLSPLTTATATAAPAAPSAPAAQSGTPATPAAATQAARRPKRKNGKHRPVIFVHGIQFNSWKTDCRSSWRNARKVLHSKYHWKAKSYTFGYYKKNTHCNMNFRGGKNTRLQEVGRQLAWRIYKHWTRHGKPVDIMAHSMGGLITKAAIQGVNRYGKSSRKWPNRLYVEDVVTLSSPFKGAAQATMCTPFSEQCSDMRSGSGFHKWLNDGNNGRPQSQMGTDYTFMGSEGDGSVSPDSATYGRNSAHWVIYGPKDGTCCPPGRPNGKQIDHSGMRTTYKGTWYAEYKNRTGGVKKRKGIKSPLVHAAHALYRARKY